MTMWKAFVAAQYAAGTPITIYYRVATPTTSQKTAVSITAAAGDNYIESTNTIPAGSISVVCRSRTP